MRGFLSYGVEERKITAAQCNNDVNEQCKGYGKCKGYEIQYEAD